MKREVGLWIDHNKSVIVTVENEVEVTREIRSNIEKHVRYSSGMHLKAADALPGSSAEELRDQQFGDHLGKYYEGVISYIREADSIWIFGPGEAKVELENRLKRAELGGRIVGIDTVEKMSDHQITAKVLDRYLSF